jgi:hypothetical protein
MGSPATIPSRVSVETRLRRGGLYCAIDGYSRWQRFAVAVAARPRRVVLVGVVGCGLCVLASGLLVTLRTGRLFEFVNFLPFDVLAPVVLVFSVVVGSVVYRRNRSVPLLAASVLRGLLLTGVLAALPFLAFGLAHLNTRLAAAAGASRAVVHARTLSLLPHVIVMLAVAVLLALEVRTGVFTKLSGLARASVESAPRTLRDVLQTLPLVLTVLFFVAFSSDSWRTFGLMSFSQLAVLVGLLLVCAAGVIRRASREDVRGLLRHEPAKQEVPAVDVDEDRDLRELAAAGITPRCIEVKHDISTEVQNQWMFQIALRVLFAGVFVALMIWLATGLTIGPGRLHTFLDQKPTRVLDLHVGTLRLYLSREGLSVAAVLGAFASLVFVGVAISDTDKRKGLFAPERIRLRRLLELAGTYQEAITRRIWLGTPGRTWPTYSAFLADEPERWNTEPVELGRAWTDGSYCYLPGNRWQAAWNRATGELYVYRGKKLGEVEVLAVYDEWEALRGRIAGWETHQYESDSLEWLRARVSASTVPV